MLLASIHVYMCIIAKKYLADFPYADEMSSYDLNGTPGNNTMSLPGNVANPYGEVILTVFRLISPCNEAILPGAEAMSAYDDVILPSFGMVSPCADIISPYADALSAYGDNVSPCIEMTSPYADTTKMDGSSVK